MSPNDYTASRHRPMLIRSARELGHLARDARTAGRLTQAQLAERVGVSRKWIIDLESGKRAADLSLVLRTLNVLGFELDVRHRAIGAEAGAPTGIDAVVEASRPRRPPPNG